MEGMVGKCAHCDGAIVVAIKAPSVSLIDMDGSPHRCLTPAEREQLVGLVEAGRKATQGEWHWCTNTAQPHPECQAWACRNHRDGMDNHGAGETTHFIAIPEAGQTIDDPDAYCYTTAVTGNGPSSEANAHFVLLAANARPLLARLIGGKGE